jgi:hypothetical protein
VVPHPYSLILSELPLIFTVLISALGPAWVVMEEV